MSQVSVVIPCRNEADRIRQLLEALSIQDAAIAEIVIVDGGSTDATLSIIRRGQAEIPSLPISVLSRHQASIPAGLNAGVGAARGDVIVRLDAHSQPAPDYVSRAIGWLQDASVGVAGGVWNVAPGAETTVARAIVRAVTHPWGAGDAAYRLASTSTHPRDVDTVPGACFRKALWEELGGFNEHLLTNEDYEFNYRVRRSGRRVLLDPAIRCAYFARASLAELARQYFRYGWWKVQMLRQHPASLRWRQALPILWLSGLLGLAAASLFDATVFPVFLFSVASYLLITVAVSIRIGLRHRFWLAIPILPLAFGVIHFAWAGGALLNVLTCGRWPDWTSHRGRSGRAGQNTSRSACATVRWRR